VGFVVSRSVGHAVVRNTVKRRLRHLMANRVSAVEAVQPATSVVVRANPAAAAADFRALARDLDACLDKLGRRSDRSSGAAPASSR